MTTHAHLPAMWKIPSDPATYANHDEPFSAGVSLVVAISTIGFLSFSIFLGWTLVDSGFMPRTRASSGAYPDPQGQRKGSYGLPHQWRPSHQNLLGSDSFKFDDDGFGHLSVPPVIVARSLSSMGVCRSESWRAALLELMTISSILRTISLAITWICGHNEEPQSGYWNVMYWLREGFFIYPSLLFAICFGVVARFWMLVERQCDSTNRWIEWILRLVMTSLHIAFFVLWITCTCISGFSVFHILTISTLALVYLALGSGSFYYGLRMASAIAPKDDGAQQNTSTADELTMSAVQRILILSLTCPPLWIIRSGLDTILLYSAVWERVDAFHLESEIIFRCFIYLGTELLPSAIMIAVFWPHAQGSMQGSGAPVQKMKVLGDSLSEALLPR